MQIYTHSGNATARLFLLKSLFTHMESGKILLITESQKDIRLLQSFAKKVFPSVPKELPTIGALLECAQCTNGIFFCHPDIFRVIGNVHAIQQENSIEIRRNIPYSLETCIEQLIAGGYTYNDYLDRPFCYKKEGGIISLTSEDPLYTIHLEWFDNEIDSIIRQHALREERTFVDTLILAKQKEKIPQDTTIPPINTALLQEVEKIFPKKNRGLIGCDFLEEKARLQKYVSWHISEIDALQGHSFDVEIPNITTIEELISHIHTHKNTLQIFTRYETSLVDFLAMQNMRDIVPASSNLRNLESFFIPKKNDGIPPLLFLTDDILGKIFVKNTRRGNLAKNLDLLVSIKPGDLIVHKDHGIGRFQEIIKKQFGTQIREYLEIQYAQNDTLFVPITEVFRVSKYLGKGDRELSRLSGKEWEHTMKQTQEELQEIAENILEVSARRSMVPGRAFGIFREKEKIFQDAFSYTHTPDQAKAIQEIFQDMETPTPMDRLLSGDVGFGKTEVAMNAAYKAVLSGFQVALISPLVVLALEHYETLCTRMEPFGIRVARISRMNSPKEIAQILTQIKNGNVDIVIGTHRLFSEDVRWKCLGLLIIDEEHKFGVLHKERIKKLRANIDVLALSATPIPRSLNLALSGVRQISILITPPKRKKPIKTFIVAWNENIIRTAIQEEMQRAGQIIIIHNRIAHIETVKRHIESLFETETRLPKIIITHGRMTGDEIESRIHAFKNREYDILLTTTIIENGVNFLCAHTIIILDPETFGLANLHQLRGRIGRKTDQGYCYLMYRKHTLSEEEKTRLITLANNNHLGAGFEIALRDMEIRGAGDILGVAQSGKSKEIGLPLYLKMLSEKIAELKEQKNRQIFTTIDLDISYTIPESYFLSELDKLTFYREIEQIDTLEELEILQKNIEENARKNNLGDISHIAPLFLLLKCRIFFGTYNVTRLSKNGKYYVFDFSQDTTPIHMKKFLECFDEDRNIALISLQKARIESAYFKNNQQFLEHFFEKNMTLS